MKFYIIIIIIIVLLPFLHLNAQQDTIPTLTEIMEEFFYNYSIEHPVNNHVSFARKEDGYYVSSIKIPPYKIIEMEKYYDFESKIFFPCYLFTKKIKPTNEISDVSELHSTPFGYDTKAKIEEYKKLPIFNEEKIYPFFGYMGFYNDIIKKYSNINELTADDLYGVCQAYSCKIRAANDNAVLRDDLEIIKGFSKNNYPNKSDVKKYL